MSGIAIWLVLVLLAFPGAGAFMHPPSLGLRPGISAAQYPGQISATTPFSVSLAAPGARRKGFRTQDADPACRAHASLGPGATGWAAASFDALANAMPSPLAQDLACGALGVVGAAVWLQVWSVLAREGLVDPKVRTPPPCSSSAAA
jgi:hypothetical protein